MKRRLPAAAVVIAVAVFSSGAVVRRERGRLAAAAATVRQRRRRRVCPGTFQVLNNDHVGTLSLPAGPYVISITGNAQLHAGLVAVHDVPVPVDGGSPRRLGRHLQRLPQGRDGVHGRAVAPQAPVPGAVEPHLSGDVQRAARHRIGPAAFAQGNYVITLLKASTSHFSCQTASRTFAYFLNTRYSKPLPYPWLLTTKTTTFTEKTNGVGFRVAPSMLLGAPADRSQGDRRRR